MREPIGEVARRELDASAVDAVLVREVESRVAAAEDYANYGRGDDAARLHAEAALVARYRA